MTQHLSDKEARKMLVELSKKESQLGLATRLKITPQYLCDVLQGRREPKGILRRLGYAQIISYEKALAKPPK